MYRNIRLYLSATSSLDNKEVTNYITPKTDIDSKSQIISIEDILPNGLNNIVFSSISPEKRRKAAILRHKKLITQNAPFFDLEFSFLRFMKTNNNN